MYIQKKFQSISWYFLRLTQCFKNFQIKNMLFCSGSKIGNRKMTLILYTLIKKIDSHKVLKKVALFIKSISAETVTIENFVT